MSGSAIASRQFASFSGGRSPGAPRAVCDGGEMVHQIAEGMQHAARIFLAEAAEFAVGAARIIGKDRLELRRLLAREMELLRGEGANADHADIAVAPGLLRDPLDDIVAVPFARAAVARFEVSRAAFRSRGHSRAKRKTRCRPLPHGRATASTTTAAAENACGRLVTLQFLGMHAEGKQHRKPAWRVRPVHVDHDVHAVAHRARPHPGRGQSLNAAAAAR